MSRPGLIIWREWSGNRRRGRLSVCPLFRFASPTASPRAMSRFRPKPAASALESGIDPLRTLRRLSIIAEEQLRYCWWRHRRLGWDDRLNAVHRVGGRACEVLPCPRQTAFRVLPSVHRSAFRWPCESSCEVHRHERRQRVGTDVAWTSQWAGCNAIGGDGSHRDLEGAPSGGKQLAETVLMSAFHSFLALNR